MARHQCQEYLFRGRGNTLSSKAVLPVRCGGRETTKAKKPGTNRKTRFPDSLPEADAARPTYRAPRLMEAEQLPRELMAVRKGAIGLECADRIDRFSAMALQLCWSGLVDGETDGN